MNNNALKKVAVLTSGGDAPGMNAAIRSVVRSSLFYNLEVYGVFRGFEGLIENDIRALNPRSVSQILQKGGTILKSARSEAFREKEGREKAFENLKSRGIEALIVIGGNGTFTGAMKFQEEFGISVMGIPGTIDNDLFGSDFTIGFDSACNTVIDAVDKIRDTALSHNRIFFVEVMGRDAGYIATSCALASGAIAAIIPERKMSIEDLISKLNRGMESKKVSSIIIVAEGGHLGKAVDIAREVEKRFSYYESKVTILGHIQRGGAPSIHDRILASKLGVGAVEGLIEGKSNCMVGKIHKDIVYTPLKDAISKTSKMDENLHRISDILST
ncbi:6-phosphofructokinase [Hyphobacterium sp. CCMP332]|nr:6-phosphofructokinase [Hyphobacterium sp. CCMP332]